MIAEETVEPLAGAVILAVGAVVSGLEAVVADTEADRLEVLPAAS